MIEIIISVAATPPPRVNKSPCRSKRCSVGSRSGKASQKADWFSQCRVNFLLFNSPALASGAASGQGRYLMQYGCYHFRNIQTGMCLVADYRDWHARQCRSRKTMKPNRYLLKTPTTHRVAFGPIDLQCAGDSGQH